MLRVRSAAVAGTFYPGDAGRLATDIAKLLAAVVVPPNERLPKAIIVPHAGYVYSGPIAATAFARLACGRDQIKRVVLLGPSHRVALFGLALPTANAFDTPLGRIQVDDAMAEALNLPREAAPHAREHSLEVELPFLQTVLAPFLLLPVAIGDTTPNEVAKFLDKVWGGPETLIVVSSDLSHFLPYAQAQVVDGNTAKKIVEMNGPLGYEEACGAAGINGLLLTAKQRGLSSILLDLRTSGDTAGNKNEVVGYGAFAFYEGFGAN